LAEKGIDHLEESGYPPKYAHAIEAVKRLQKTGMDAGRKKPAITRILSTSVDAVRRSWTSKNTFWWGGDTHIGI
jgi:hypothetical protein